jgi:predicted DNA-binding protein
MRKRIGLFLDREQLRQLQAISDDTGAPVSELIRRAIEAYLATRKKGGHK